MITKELFQTVKNYQTGNYGVHPRILWSPELLEKVKAERGQKAYNTFFEYVDTLLDKEPPEYDENAPETELYQRPVGDTMTLFAFAYIVSGDMKYANAGMKWVKKSCSYKTWGRVQDPTLPKGHQLMGMGLFYDWCYDVIPNELKAEMEKKLNEHMLMVYKGIVGDIPCHWLPETLLNIHWIMVGGMGVAAMAIFDKEPDARACLPVFVSDFSDVVNAFGTDGIGHEGLLYWSYGMSNLLPVLEIINNSFGIDLFDSLWLKNTGYAYIYYSLPFDKLDCDGAVLDFCDSQRGTDAEASGILEFLAYKYQDGYIENYAKMLRERGLSGGKTNWFELIAATDPPKPKPLEKLPKFKHFDDMGMVISHSSWRDGGVLGFKCGPFMGHKDMEESSSPPYNDKGAGHSHPDVNHFILYGNGEFLIRDDEYVYKRTHNHNTLLINDKGQQGGEQMWFRGKILLRRKANPTILKAETTEKFDYIVGDGTEAYDPSLGLKKYIRHMLYIKPDIVVVADELETEEKSDLELRFIPESDISYKVDGGYVMAGKKTNVLITNPISDGGRLESNFIKYSADINNNTRDKLAVSCKNSSDKWFNITVIQYAPFGKRFERVTAERTEDGFLVHTENEAINVNTKAREVCIFESKEKPVTDGGSEVIGVLVNGVEAEKRANGYFADIEKDYRLVRAGMNDVNISVIAKNPYAEISVRKNENKYGEYSVCINAAEHFTVDVKSTPFDGIRVEPVGVTASTLNSAKAILDSNRNTQWVVFGKNQWACIELEESIELEGVDISWFRGDMRKAFFEIMLSEDGESFTSCGSFTASGRTSKPEFYAIEGKGRFVKINCNGNSVSDYNTIIDVGIYKRNPYKAADDTKITEERKAKN